MTYEFIFKIYDLGYLITKINSVAGNVQYIMLCAILQVLVALIVSVNQIFTMKIDKINHPHKAHGIRKEIMVSTDFLFDPT